MTGRNSQLLRHNPKLRPLLGHFRVPILEITFYVVHLKLCCMMVFDHDFMIA